MYAIIETGGKQYRVEKGDIIDVELLGAKEGDPVEFKNVLFVNNGKAVQIGSPNVENSLVKGELLALVRGPKEFTFKYKQRKGIRKRSGHRQNYARIKITDIVGA